MKKLFAVLRCAALSLAVILCGACTHNDLDYLSALPSDAVMVFSFNPTGLATKADLKQLLDAKMPLLEQSMSGEKMFDLMKSLAKDPASSGLDLKRPVAIYVSDIQNVTAGCVLPVADVDKLKTLFATLQQQEFCTVKDSEIEFPGGILFGKFDKHTLVLACSAEAAREQLKQSKHKSLMGDPSFVKFCDTQGDLNFWINPSKMPQETLSYYKKIYGDLDMDAMRLTYNLNFEKGKVVVKVNVDFTDNKVRKQFAKFAEQYNGALGDRLLTFVPGDAMGVLALNIKDGAKVYDLLSGVKELSQFIEQCNQTAGVDVKELLSSIKGDVVLAVSPATGASLIPQVSILIESTNNKLAKTLADRASEQGMQPKLNGADNYTLTIPGVDLPVEWGYAGGITYVTDAAATAAKIRAGKPLANNFGSTPEAKKFKKSSSAFEIDMKAVNHQYGAMLAAMGSGDNGAVVSMAMGVMGSIDRISGYNENQFGGTMNITLMNTTDNALKQIVFGLVK